MLFSNKKSSMSITKSQFTRNIKFFQNFFFIFQFEKFLQQLVEFRVFLGGSREHLAHISDVHVEFLVVELQNFRDESLANEFQKFRC